MGLVHRASSPKPWFQTHSVHRALHIPPYHTRPMLPEVSGLRLKAIVLLILLFYFLLFIQSFLLLRKHNSLITGNKDLTLSHVTLQRVKYQIAMSLDCK